MASVQASDMAAATVTTANATPTTILTYTPIDGATTYLRVYVAGKNGTTVGCAFQRGVTFRRNGNTVTQIGSVVQVGTMQDAALNTTTVTFTTGTGTIIIQVTGVAATTIDWQVFVDTVAA